MSTQTSILDAWTFSILAVGSFPQTWVRLAFTARLRRPFSILAVGSFPQTKRAGSFFAVWPALSVSSLLDRFLRRATHRLRNLRRVLSVSSLLDRFLRLFTRRAGHMHKRLSVSSLLDRFLRLLEVAKAIATYTIFQYPRCWIVSSDTSQFSRLHHRCESFSILAVGSFPQTRQQRSQPLLVHPLSVSSLLDRFLRHHCVLPHPDQKWSFSILAVGSFPQTLPHPINSKRRVLLSVSSLLDRFLRRKIPAVLIGEEGTFSILAVGSFPQT